jgi:hypothetical protein
MSWDSEADELYPHTVTLAPPGTMGGYGRATVGTAVSRSALVEHKLREVRTKDGAVTTSTIAVYLNGSAGVLSVTPEWKLTLPDATSRPILSVARYADEDGDLHEIVYLQ